MKEFFKFVEWLDSKSYGKVIAFIIMLFVMCGVSVLSFWINITFGFTLILIAMVVGFIGMLSGV
jgi:hypothetical protein